MTTSAWRLSLKSWSVEEAVAAVSSQSGVVEVWLAGHTMCVMCHTMSVYCLWGGIISTSTSQTSQRPTATIVLHPPLPSSAQGCTLLLHTGPLPSSLLHVKHGTRQIRLATTHALMYVLIYPVVFSLDKLDRDSRMPQSWATFFAHSHTHTTPTQVFCCCVSWGLTAVALKGMDVCVSGGSSL